MSLIDKIRKADPALADKIEGQGSFVTEDDIDGIVSINRHMLLLVRCGNGRFLTPAQDVKHFTGIISEHATMKAAARGIRFAGEYVRDVSLPSNVHVTPF